jgi:hypothetical protein
MSVRGTAVGLGIRVSHKGLGSNLCGSDALWDTAYGYSSRDCDHRYLYHATAICLDLSRSKSGGPWLSAAVAAAVDEVGPENHYDDLGV